MIRNVKIARLPRPLRDELNRRLAANEDGATLLDWLNDAPGVQDLLARDFAGEPVGRQNLHEWRHGGFVEWQTRQNLFAAAADLTDANGEWDALAANDFTERLAAVLVVRYADALAAWNGGDDEAFRLKLRDLRRFNQDLAVLRRYNQSAARLKMEQMHFYREEQQRAGHGAPSRKQSAAGARADGERLARRRREAEAAQTLTPMASAPTAPEALAFAPFPACAPDRTSAVSSAAAVITTDVAKVVDIAGLPRSGSGKELPTRDAAHGFPAEVQPDASPRFGCPAGVPVKAGTTNGSEFRPLSDQSPATVPPKSGVAPAAAAAAENESAQPAADRSHVGKCDAGKNIVIGAATLAAGLIRANLVIQFADSLRNSLTVIKEKSVHALDLKDRRAVQAAYYGSVSTVNRLGREAGLLRAELPGFAEVDRVSTAVEVLTREYPRMKSNLFQGCSAAIAVGIPQWRDAACELRETLQRRAAIGASPAV
jgi:hypothetical protein